MTVYVSINGVLRDFWSKLQQEYRKLYLEHEPEEEETFEYKINDVPSANIMERFAFQSEDEMKFFLYVENPMEIFGHAAPVYKNVLLDLLKWRSQQKPATKVVLVSEEYGKSIPATFFFLSKIAASINHVQFYQGYLDIERMWGECDTWITDDPKIIEMKPPYQWLAFEGKYEDKKIIKVLADYNEHLPADVTINKLSDLIQDDEQTQKPQIENGELQ
jgi:hypothetical protein